MVQKTGTSKYFIIHVLLLLLITGCSLASPTTILLVPTSTIIPIPSATILPITPSATLAHLSSPTFTPSCPQFDSQVKFIPPKTNDEIVEKVLSFINAGGDLNQINSYYSQFKLKPLDILAADLNEDGSKEIIVAGALPLEFKSKGAGVIYILGCRRNSYEIDKQFDSQNLSSAQILRTEKLLANYPQQVIIRYRPISGWASHILAIGYMNNDWQVVFEDSELFPNIVVFDQDNDGNKEISIQSITTATQGPQRKIISNFKWDGKQYSRISDQLMPGSTRVEYFDDAERALKQGDISLAIADYDIAAHESSLGDFASRDEIERRETNLAGDYQKSFALFRLMTLWLSVNDSDNAKLIMKELEEDFPAYKHGSEFTQAAEIFYDQIVKGDKPQDACTTVSSFFLDKYPDINIHIGDWGVTVVEYSKPDELCPLR